MGIKKMLGKTVNAVVGGVAINESNKIATYGGIIGTSIGAGMAMDEMNDMPKSKKKKGWF